MKMTIPPFVPVLLLLCAPLAIAQDTPAPPAETPQAAPSSQHQEESPPPATFTPDSSLGSFDALNKACEERALFTTAQEYCRFFAGLLIEPDPSGGRLRRLVEPETNPDSLATSLLIVKTTGAVEGVAESSLNLLDQAIVAGVSSDPQKKQVVAPPVGSAATGLVAKTAGTGLLAVAVESGALTKTQSGNVITLQANADHLFRQIFTADLGHYYLPPGAPVLESLTVSASLAANTNSTISVPTSGSATSSPIVTQNVQTNSSVTKLSALTVSYEFNNKLTQRYLKHWLAKHHQTHIVVTPDATTFPGLQNARNALQNDFQFESLPGCKKEDYLALANQYANYWRQNKDKYKGKPSPELFTSFVQTVNSCFAKVSKTALGKNPKLDSDLTAYIQALDADIGTFQKKLVTQIPGWDLTAQYVYNRPAGQPITHDLRVIGGGNLSRTAGSIWTVNGAATLYGSVPAGAKYSTLKDMQVAAEFDRSFGSKSTAPSIGIAGYGQYQSKPSVLNITSTSVPSGVTLPPNAQVFLAGTDGWLGVVQVKFTLNVGGAQVPVAVKWSNKTELLDKSKLGAQFGISYDFAKLKQLVGLGSSPGN